MDASEMMELFDSCWFEKEIFKNQSISSKSSRSGANADQEIEELAKSTSFDGNPDQEIQEIQEMKISRIPSTILRSMSDDLYSKTSFGSGNYFPHSPDSVLVATKLQTIFSGKESTRGEDEGDEKFPAKQRIFAEESAKRKVLASKRRRKKNNSSKSLSELEYEELKGFMDLGFVFSEEDNKDSSLVSIIPGLQRLGKKDEEEDVVADGSSAISRPYLSEAWEEEANNFEIKKRIDPLMNWRIPAFNDEIDMKDKLRWWAHTVASAVR